MLLAVEEKPYKPNKYGLTINERLKEARNKKGFSMDKTVRELKLRGIPSGKSTIQGYEADEEKINHRYPSLYMLQQLADLYGCSMDYLFGDTDEFYRPSNDLAILLNEQEHLLWRGKAIEPAQLAMIMAKVDQIMAL